MAAWDDNSNVKSTLIVFVTRATAIVLEPRYTASIVDFCLNAAASSSLQMARGLQLGATDVLGRIASVVPPGIVLLLCCVFGCRGLDVWLGNKLGIDDEEAPKRKAKSSSSRVSSKAHAGTSTSGAGPSGRPEPTTGANHGNDAGNLDEESEIRQLMHELDEIEKEIAETEADMDANSKAHGHGHSHGDGGERDHDHGHSHGSHANDDDDHHGGRSQAEPATAPSNAKGQRKQKAAFSATGGANGGSKPSTVKGLVKPLRAADDEDDADVVDGDAARRTRQQPVAPAESAAALSARYRSSAFVKPYLSLIEKARVERAQLLARHYADGAPGTGTDRRSIAPSNGASAVSKARSQGSGKDKRL